jgi:hypothetical protein
LGDNIWKKSSNIIHFIKTESKPFIHYLDTLSSGYLGNTHIGISFRHKYHEHEYQQCRLIQIKETIRHETVWKTVLNQYILDIICVSAHYSTRYGSSDNYILSACNDAALSERVFYLKDNSQEVIVGRFVSEYLERLGNNTIEGHGYINSTKISWKNMQYLWRHFLKQVNLPSIVFQPTLKTILISQLSQHYILEDDSFQELTSKYLPAIQHFMRFWEETIVLDQDEVDFEIEELTSVFRDWSKRTPILLNESQILDILGYYYPTILVQGNKYIQGIRCSMWDKGGDIRDSITNMVELVDPIVSFYDCYIHYCKYYTTTESTGILRQTRNIASKSYFEKYLIRHFPENIVDGSSIDLRFVS